MEMLRINIVRNKIEVFDQEERLLVEHRVAMQCFDLEELIQDGVTLFGDICRVDQNFHEVVLEHPDKYREEIALQILEAFAKWDQVVSRIVSFFASVQGDYCERGFDMKRFDALMRCHRECIAMLNPSNVETNLADDALASHRNGLTVSM